MRLLMRLRPTHKLTEWWAEPTLHSSTENRKQKTENFSGQGSGQGG